MIFVLKRYQFVSKNRPVLQMRATVAACREPARSHDKTTRGDLCFLLRPSSSKNTSFCPSVRPSVCPSVRPERFPGICRRTHGGNDLKFYTLMSLDHLQNWLVYGYGLLIFLILALFWLSETGQIWGFRAFLAERMEEMAWNFARWCILTTFRTD